MLRLVVAHINLLSGTCPCATCSRVSPTMPDGDRIIARFLNRHTSRYLAALPCALTHSTPAYDQTAPVTLMIRDVRSAHARLSGCSCLHSELHNRRHHCIFMQTHCLSMVSVKTRQINSPCNRCAVTA